jgi:hypothetical protein
MPDGILGVDPAWLASMVSVLLYLCQSISPNHRYINVAVSYNRKPSNYIAATHTLSVMNVHRQIC